MNFPAALVSPERVPVRTLALTLKITGFIISVIGLLTLQTLIYPFYDFFDSIGIPLFSFLVLTPLTIWSLIYDFPNLVIPQLFHLSIFDESFGSTITAIGGVFYNFSIMPIGFLLFLSSEKLVSFKKEALRYLYLALGLLIIRDLFLLFMVPSLHGSPLSGYKDSLRFSDILYTLILSSLVFYYKYLYKPQFPPVGTPSASPLS